MRGFTFTSCRRDYLPPPREKADPGGLSPIFARCCALRASGVASGPV
ncbi:uncharacterized protein AruCF_5438 [Achromobacter ruhlandii]|nr:uncharacterized protein AruCF_5438 [Achromobacter ruhlandii]